tara:strand:- start:5549 stop:5701 length:153 start_codon:yes stop_codon:yes gene_type:complete
MIAFVKTVTITSLIANARNKENIKMEVKKMIFFKPNLKNLITKRNGALSQ